ncbi:MAG: (2Fe-2S)-binding protein [Sphaerochaeta sp.]|nr:(2Fe-2S)-binding protein [Sphaerochaeta sp.]
MQEKKTVTFVLNGIEKNLETERSWTLLHVLREVYDLTGTKYGCGTNDCGACKVLLDGMAINSCSFPIHKVEGKSVLTIEGVTLHPRLSLIQDSFVEAHAIQCGFCTPGMVISAAGLLLHTKNPTEQEIREALKGNLCRCTGYVHIVEAVQLASEKIQEYDNGKV